ncbi:hypothetical protein DICPUDRAFT_150899 [Dictyostelium purpureum]|uniref:Large ribosomal subunit protein mL49 n=1 Tax=Dictyostelium purpureum TaxID=5786 RepID=F0ZHJ0_DICPU|nr:uncharacterized protein DICPUDRAFT_150899 [Dictyostelium purpureum]EGC36593.1 hypothetical protein DICPUDRAFT_150899 [Dictyostelium purpureum]|eukprot:XP_003286897.1 hypothetical protein DICPUDRAFT_150899 [Dictyostelium purpureum]
MFKRVLSLNLNNSRLYCSKVNQNRLLPNFRETKQKEIIDAEKIYSITPVKPLKYPIDPIKNSQVYFVGKTTESVKYPDIPFVVKRTSTGKLPVYTERIGRYNNENFTILRKFDGDRNILKSELSNLLGESIPIKERAESFEIKGDHQKTIMVWLAGLGF